MEKAIFIMYIALFALVSAAATDSKNTKLYFVTGTPTPKSQGRFPSRLYTISSNHQSLHLVREIVPASSGTNFIYAYPDYRLMVFASPPVSSRAFSLLYMDNPDTEISLDFKGKICDRCSVIDVHILNAPNDGLILSVESVSAASSQILLKRLSDRQDIQENPFLQGYVIAAGTSGGAIPGNFYDVLPMDRGRLLIPIAEKKDGKWRLHEKVEIPWHLPSEISIPPKAYVVMVINNPMILALISRDPRVKVSGTLEYGKYYFLDKASLAWHKAAFPGEAQSIRGFGTWISGHVIEKYKGIPSPGIEKRRKVMTESSTPIDWRFEMEGIYAPGILFLYNIRTRQQYRIDTRQGDSEILLIDGGQVYYRINDEIFKAAIEEKTIGQSTLLAKGEMVPDIHWAFMGPSKETASVIENVASVAKNQVPVEKSNWLDRLKERAILISFVIAGVFLVGGVLVWGIFGYFSKRRSGK